jgi:hypothetical protein
MRQDSPAVDHSERLVRDDVLRNSEALARLISEVEVDKPPVSASQYNRTYNRHNR